jgi:hypothetical protein
MRNVIARRNGQAPAPAKETIEFTRRVVNAPAIRSKENHARNLKLEDWFALTLQRYRNS